MEALTEGTKQKMSTKPAGVRSRRPRAASAYHDLSRGGGAARTPVVEPQRNSRSHQQCDEGDGRESDGEESHTVAEALLWQNEARPVDGDRVGQLVGPARVLVRQPRGVGGGEDSADLVEAK